MQNTALDSLAATASSSVPSAHHPMSSTKDSPLIPGTALSTSSEMPIRYAVKRTGATGDPWGMSVSTGFASPTSWAEVLKETKRWKSRWTVRDLLADERCGGAVLDFLSSTDVGRLVPPVDEEDDAGSEVSEWELRERRERQEEQEGEAEALGAVDGRGDGEELPLFLPPPCIHGIGRRGVGDGSRVSFVLSFVNFFGRVYGQAGWRAKGSLQRAATARTADRKIGQNARRHDLHRSNASMIKQKKKPRPPPRRERASPSGLTFRS